MQMLTRLFLINALITAGLFADKIDDSVLNFEKKRFSQNKRITLKDVSVSRKVQIPVTGWYGYVIDVTAEVQGKELKAKDMVFSNGQVVAAELFDAKTGDSLKELLAPQVGKAYYQKTHLIAGNHNAKDKIVVFSDPLCPFCMDFVPDVINHVQKYNKTIALYYYHFPLLQLHPAAKTLTKLMDVAKVKGIKDIELKVYEADWDPHFKERETNEQTIVTGFNKVFKTNISLEEINDVKIKASIRKDVSMGEELMVQGTPTIYINGVNDKSKIKYETLGK